MTLVYKLAQVCVSGERYKIIGPRLILENGPCGGILNDDTGVIVVNRGGDASWSDCLWTIKAPNGTVIELEVEVLDLTYFPFCDSDFLQVFLFQGIYFIYAGLINVYLNW